VLATTVLYEKHLNLKDHEYLLLQSLSSEHQGQEIARLIMSMLTSVDHFEFGIPLTSSFQVALRKLQKSTEPKIYQAHLIQQREIGKVAHDIEERRRKHATGKHVQSHGVIYKGHAARQIAHRYESVYNAKEETKNMYLERRNKEADAYWIKLLVALWIFDRFADAH
jgi:hypothetical protein